MNIRRELDDNLRKELINLRLIAWDNKLNDPSFKPFHLIDSLDEISMHFIIEDKNKLIGAARICLINSLKDIEEGIIYSSLNFKFSFPCAFIGKLVIHPDYQKKGLGTSLINSRMEYLKESKVKLAFCGVNSSGIEILNKFGFCKGEQLRTDLYENWNLGDEYFLMYNLIL